MTLLSCYTGLSTGACRVVAGEVGGADGGFGWRDNFRQAEKAKVLGPMPRRSSIGCLKTMSGRCGHFVNSTASIVAWFHSFGVLFSGSVIAEVEEVENGAVVSRGEYIAISAVGVIQLDLDFSGSSVGAIADLDFFRFLVFVF